MVGWDATAKLVANMSDYVQANMISSGNWKKGQAPKFVPAQRPWVEAKKRVSHGVSDEMSLSDMHKIFVAKAASQR